MSLQTYIFYGAALLALTLSLLKDRQKTKAALKKAWKAFENILPQFLTVVILVGILLTVVDAQVISRLLGGDSGFFGVLLAALLGAVTLMPPFVAFPTAALLLQSGAGYMQLGAFVSSLTMVGVVTIPVEMKFFGRRLTLLRNAYAFLFSFLVAYIIYLAVG